MKRNQLVHVLVLEAFIGSRPDGLVAAHLNGIPSDNRIENLIWATIAENEAHKIVHGTLVHGETHHKAIIDRYQAREILDRAMAGEDQATIAADYGISRSSVSKLKHGKTWKLALAALQ